MDDRHAHSTLPDFSADIFAKAQNCPGGAQLQSAQTHSGGERLLHLDPLDLPCQRVKFMCSHGGKILPRPSDRKLRYVGGETRLFSVPRHIHYTGLLNKMTEIYGQDLTVKYQLPDEDLDALVSICSDEDLENMMEECSRLDSRLGLSRLRVFVFPLSELDAANLSDVGDTKILEERYVDAVNEVPPEAAFRRQNDHAPADSSINSEGHDAYARNATHMQEKSYFLSENPQSEVLFLGNFVPSANTLLSKTLLPEHVMAATFPPHTPSHSTFTTQPAVLEGAPEGALDQLANISGSRGAILDVDTFLDLECGSSASSSASSHYELHHRLPDSGRVPSSSLQALKELTLHRNDEERAYRDEQRCIAEVRGHKGALHGRMHVKILKEGLPSGEPPDLQEERGGLASVDDNERSDNQSHRDLPWSTTTLQQNQLQADWHQVEIPCDDDKLIVMNSLQQPPQNSGFGQQQAFTVEQQQQPWQNLLFCNPLATLDQKSARLGHMEEHSPEDSLGAQMLFPAEAHPVPQQTSTSVYQTGCSAPSSPTRGKMTADTGKPGAFPLQGQIHQTLMTDFSDQEFPSMLSDYDGACKNKASWCASGGHLYWSFLKSENSLPEESIDPYHLGRKLVDAADPHFNGQPVLAWSSVMPKQQVGSPTFQDHEDFKDAEAFSKRLQPPCLSLVEEPLPTANLAAINTYAAAQSENEQFHTLGRIPLNLVVASPHSAVGGDKPTLGRAMVLDSLQQSSRLSNCLPAEIPVADMSTSMSLGCPLEPCQGGDDFMPREKTEPTVGTISVIQPSMSLQINSEDKSFAFAQDSMFSVEQFNPIRCQENAKTWLSAFDEDTDLDDTKSLEIFGENLPTAADPPLFLALSLSAATWETSFSQAEHVHCAVMENLSKEKGLDGLDLGLAMENEVTYEDFNLEIEELDRFESSADQTSNAAVNAENEAISRGLQTVRNFDLEELSELGSGTFGTVYHGKWRGTDVAIKRIKSSCFTGRQSERERLIADFWREAYILGQLHHPNVVAFYGVVPDGPGGTLATVTEYMVNGSLKQVLQKKDRTLDRRKRLLIAMDAAFGMEYLHGRNVVHFDIKCENLLVNLRDTQRPICKVGDLGLSKVKQQTMVSGGVRGTLPWMAPELLNGSSSLVSEKVDVFSFGIVLWELLTGEEPYANMHYGAIIGGIVNNTLRPPIPKWCDPAWRSVMEKCWSADPAERPTFTEIAGSLRMMEASLNAKGQGQALTAGRYN